MKPDLEVVLQTLATTLFTDFVPHVSDDYQMKTMAMVGVLMIVSADQIDQQADLYVTDNDAIRSVFRTALETMPHSKLPQGVSETAFAEEESYRVSALRNVNNRLRQQLIALHTAVETETSDPAKALNKSIWQLISADVERRIIELPNLEG